MTLTASRSVSASRYAAPLLLALGLAACSGEAPTSAGASGALMGAPEGNLVTVVNGEAVSEPLLDVYARGRGLDPADPADRQRALDSLIENIVLAQTALASELAQRPEVQAEAALVRMQQLAGRQIAAIRSDIEVSETDLRSYYDREAERAGSEELRLRHILFADELAAVEAVAAALQPDADFEAVMADFEGRGALQARELDWANMTQLPPELADAAKQLEDGEVAPVPIQSSFGWHALQRVESRPLQLPAFDQVREGARRQLTEQALAERVKALREQADIAGEQAGEQAAEQAGASGGDE
jgi:peptidyl-prolyl cis-trans isomerase C